MFWKMKKKYKVKQTDRRISSEVKKNPKKDLRPWSKVFFFGALASLIWGSNELLNLTEYDYSINSTGNTTYVSTTLPSDTGVEDPSSINILSLELEQIENLANTIAGQNAIWPGYKGDPNNHVAVRNHFAENFAKFINSGIIRVEPQWAGQSVAFAYAVSETGVVQFVGKIPGGTLEDDYSYVAVQKGISGKVQVIPAQDENGENIIMIYRIKVRFAVL